MRSIRDTFLSKITQSAASAVGVSVVLKMGVDYHQQFAANYPDSKLYVGAGPPKTPGVRTIQLAPTHQHIQSILLNNSEILYELYLTELVQHWFDFLLNIYQKALQDNLSGISQYLSGIPQYSIPPTKIKVDFTLIGLNLTQSLVEAACSDFDFLPAPDKLKKVRQTLGVDLSPVLNDVALIKMSIQVRNILQHRGGIVSQKDLDDLGVASITEDHGNTTKGIVAGQKVTRTGFDIENLVNALRNVSHTLIP